MQENPSNYYFSYFAGDNGRRRPVEIALCAITPSAKEGFRRSTISQKRLTRFSPALHQAAFTYIYKLYKIRTRNLFFRKTRLAADGSVDSEGQNCSKLSRLEMPSRSAGKRYSNRSPQGSSRICSKTSP